MKALGIVFSIAMLAIALYAAYIFYREWWKTEPSKTKFQRAIEAAKQSETVLWNQFVVIIAGVVAQLDNIADALNMPQLKSFIDQWFTPKTVAAVMLGVALISIKARLRSSSNDPVK